MRTQGQDRFTGQANWKAGRVGSATEQVVAAINEEKRWQSAVLEFIPNSQNKPKYSLAVTYLIGAVILVCMGFGVWIGVAYGY